MSPYSLFYSPVSVVHVTTVLLGVLVLWRQVVSRWINYVIALASAPRPVQELGHWAVVTGATDGIGKALAKELGNRGMSLLLVGRNQEKLNDTQHQLKQQLPNFKGSLETFRVDLSSNEPGYLTGLHDKLKGLDVGVLVNCAGIGYPHAMYYNEVPSDLIDELVRVNLTSLMRITQFVYEGMCNRKRGAIICVGSGAAAAPSEPLYAAYVATKAAVMGFCQSLQVECADKNVLVQCHTPLLVTSKLSKCKTPTFTTPSAEQYASCAVHAIQRGCTAGSSVVSPYWVHSLILFVANFLPVAFWNTFRLGECQNLRIRALKKKQEKENEGDNHPINALITRVNRLINAG